VSLGLPTHRPHHALGDALTTAQVFVALATHLNAFSTETVRSLARAKTRLD
jgi:DNA polymerase-3 subunit epsilon